MIEHLAGRVIAKIPGGVVLSVAGVGYGVELGEEAAARIITQDTGSEVSFFIHTHVREDQIKLFGFHTYEERRLFQILLSLSGIGPRLALGIIGTLSVELIVTAALGENATIFEQVSGVGSRLAKKLVVELKPKLEKEDDLRSRLTCGAVATISTIAARPAVVKQVDLRSALENLGYAAREINQAFAQSNLDWDAPVEALLRKILQGLRSAKAGESRYAAVDESELPF